MCKKTFVLIIRLFSTQKGAQRVWFTWEQWRNQLFGSGRGDFHEISFDDVIVLNQSWCNVFANGHR